MKVGIALPWIVGIIMIVSPCFSCKETSKPESAPAPFPNSRSHVMAPKINSLSVLEVDAIEGDYGVSDYDITIVHDDKRKVTCWLFHTANSPGVWCSKDSDLEKQD